MRAFQKYLRKGYLHNNSDLCRAVPGLAHNIVFFLFLNICLMDIVIMGRHTSNMEQNVLYFYITKLHLASLSFSLNFSNMLKYNIYWVNLGKSK